MLLQRGWRGLSGIGIKGKPGSWEALLNVSLACIKEEICLRRASALGYHTLWEMRFAEDDRRQNILRLECYALLHHAELGASTIQCSLQLSIQWLRPFSLDILMTHCPVKRSPFRSTSPESRDLSPSLPSSGPQIPQSSAYPAHPFLYPQPPVCPLQHRISRCWCLGGLH